MIKPPRAALFLVTCAGTLPAQERPAEMLHRAIAETSRGEYRPALENLNRVIVREPQNPLALAHRGFVRTELGDQMGASQDLDAAMRIHVQVTNLEVDRAPSSIAARLRRASARDAIGDHKGAVEDYSEILQREATNAQTWFDRGNARYRLGDKQGALDDYAEAVRLDPNLAPAYAAR